MKAFLELLFQDTNVPEAHFRSAEGTPFWVLWVAMLWRHPFFAAIVHNPHHYITAIILTPIALVSLMTHGDVLTLTLVWLYAIGENVSTLKEVR